MKCPKCGNEMKNGYLFGTKDGAFSFAEKVPSAFEHARTAEGFVEIAGLKAGGRTSVEACRCDTCRWLLIRY